MTMTASRGHPADCGTLSVTPERIWRCGPGGSETFAIVPEPIDTITVAGSVTESTVKDTIYQTTTGASVRRDYLATVTPLTPLGIEDKAVTVESSNTAVLADPVDSLAVGVSSGSATLIARASDGEVSASDVTVSITVGDSVVRPLAHAEGTLGRHCYDQLFDRTAGKTRDSMPIWSVRNHSAGQYEWNPDCWGASIDNLSCISAWVSNGTSATLVTPRHVVSCHHLGFYPQVGNVVRFVRPSGVAESFTVTDVAPHPYSAGWIASLHDLVVCKLDRDVPEDIKFAKVLPIDPQPYLPTVKSDDSPGGIFAWPHFWLWGCWTNQFRRLATGYITALQNEPYPDVRPGQSTGQQVWYTSNRWRFWSSEYYSVYNIDNDFGDNIIIGDSGSPAFVLINDELALTNLWTGIGTGYALHTDAVIINGLLDDLGGGYQLTAADVSEFPTYTPI